MGTKRSSFIAPISRKSVAIGVCSGVDYIAITLNPPDIISAPPVQVEKFDTAPANCDNLIGSRSPKAHPSESKDH